MNTDERSRLRAWAAALIFVGAVVSFSVAGGAETRVVGVVGSKEKTVESLSVEVNALEMRVKKLEAGLIAVQRSVKKADSPDADGGSDKPDKKGGDGGKNTNGGGQGSNEAGSEGSNQSGSASTQGDNSGALKDVTPNTAHPTKPSSNAAIPMTVRAPFRVVDSAGKTILLVNDPTSDKPAGERGVYIYGATGNANIALTTGYSGGKLFINTDGDSYSVALGAVSDGAGLKIRADRKLRQFTGLDIQGKGLVNVYGKDSDQPAAGLQTTDEDKGLVAVFNANKPVAFLAQSGAHPGGGNVTVADPNGNGVFSAGYDGEGGAACVDHKQSMHCLGIGLPLGGGQ